MLCGSCLKKKLPRVPVAENIPGNDMPMYRDLWKHIGPKMPKAGRGKAGSLNPLELPPQLMTALDALYGHYVKTFELWEKAGKVPPCFIVVCNNTSTSKLVDGVLGIVDCRAAVAVLGDDPDSPFPFMNFEQSPEAVALCTAGLQAERSLGFPRAYDFEWRLG